MTHYIDGFVLPLPRDQLDAYRGVVEKVASIWVEHGALDYSEFVSDDTKLEGTRPFAEFAGAKEDEAVIFGWIVFASRDARDLANQRVAVDPRMPGLIDPITHSSKLIFDARRMVYGGFQSLVQLSNTNAG